MRPGRDDEYEEDDDLDIEEAPTGIDPYATLGIDKEATQEQIKSAYRKAALKHHPDKVAASDKETANIKFQEIAFAYAVLSDERRRKRYDVTGNTEDSLEGEDGEGDFDWISFYREQFRDIVTPSAIDAFAKEYKGSEEEREAVLKSYTKQRGQMARLYQQVMLSEPVDDEERFRAIIDAAIEANEVEAFTAYTEESAKSRKTRIEVSRKNKAKEAKEAEKHAKDLGIGGSAKTGAEKGSGMDGLAALIQQRQKARSGNFLADLEAKYAPKPKKGSKRAADEDEPPEEAFAQTEARRTKKKGKKA